jgi:hypothetical protein
VDVEPKLDEMIVVANRTLRAAGYDIFQFQRMQNLAEFRCRISSRLGAVISFFFGFTSEDDFSREYEEEARRVSGAQGLALVLVSLKGGIGQVSWSDFLRAMGGGVPSWRALQTNYSSALTTASIDQLPLGEGGEAWVLFEDLIADGLEFAFGRRVRRFGGRRRGQKVSDMIAQLPNFDLLVVDGKAAKKPFDAGWPQLRPLVEYVKKQQQRQNGHNNVVAALLVSSDFKQGSESLRTLSDEFFAQTRVPLCFATAPFLAFVVDALKDQPHLRNAISWSSIFVGGLLERSKFQKLIEEARSERIECQEG